MLAILAWLTFLQTFQQPLFLAPIPDSQIVSTSLPAANPERLLAQASLDLSQRWPQAEINQGFTDNILLSLHYLNNAAPYKDSADKNSQDTNSPSTSLRINWEKVRQDFEVEFVLKPGEVFAFHKNVLSKYEGKVIKTMGSEFVTTQGYKVVSGLGGNGVCHLASLINWVASEAGLAVEAPSNHSFAPIADVPKTYWTSIRFAKQGGNSQNQNLYMSNDSGSEIKFTFQKQGDKLSLGIFSLK